MSNNNSSNLNSRSKKILPKGRTLRNGLGRPLQKVVLSNAKRAASNNSLRRQRDARPVGGGKHRSNARRTKKCRTKKCRTKKR